MERKTQRARISLLFATIALSLVLALGVVAGLSRLSLAVTAPPPDGENGKAPPLPRVVLQSQHLNFSPPSETVKLVFIHHSTGENWLNNDNGALLQALNDNNYYVSDAGRGGPDSIGDRTDIGDWPEWFVGPNAEAVTEWLYQRDGTRTNSIPNPDEARENEIVMFKSCFPNSDILGNPDDPPNDDLAPPRGFTPGSPEHNVANVKRVYIDILAYFETRQDKLFIVVTAPPLRAQSTDATHAANARAFNDWLMHEWLADYPYQNVAVFDFFNVLTTNGGSANENDYGLSSGNHHRLITTTRPMTIEHATGGDDDTEPNYLEYPSLGGTNDHPSQAGNRKATGEFVPLLNVYYHCWQYGACGLDVSQALSLTVVDAMARIDVGETATYAISVTASAGLTEAVALTLAAPPPHSAFAFVPNPADLPGTSQLRITTTAATVPGAYFLSLLGASGSVTDTAWLTLAVQPVLTLTARPNWDMVPPGETASYAVSVTASAALTEAVDLALATPPPHTAFAFVPGSISPPGTSQLRITTTANTMSGSYALSLLGASGSVTDTAWVTLTVRPVLTLTARPDRDRVSPGETASYAVSVTASAGLSKAVDLALTTAPPHSAFAFVPNPVNLPGAGQLRITTTAATLPGAYSMLLVGTLDGVTDTAWVTLTVRPLLTLTARPNWGTVRPGETVSYAVSVMASAGLTEVVDLALAASPSHSAFAFVPNPVSPPGTSQLYITTTAAVQVGTFPMTVSAVVGTVRQALPVTLTVRPTLTLRGQPRIWAVTPGGVATYTLSTHASLGFTAPLTLALQDQPQGTVVNFVPNPLICPGVSQLYLTTTAATRAGTFSMTVSGTSVALTATTDLALVVSSEHASFTLGLRPQTRTVEGMQTTFYTVVITRVNDFSWPVALTVMGLPDGVGADWSVNPLTATDRSLLGLSVLKDLPSGAHLFHVVGTATTQTVTRSARLIVEDAKFFLPLVLKSS